MKGKIIYPVLFFLTFLLNYTFGQTNSDTIASDTVKLYLIETTDGNQYIGEIVFEDIGTFVAIPWLGLTIPFGKKSN